MDHESYGLSYPPTPLESARRQPPRPVAHGPAPSLVAMVRARPSDGPRPHATLFHDAAGKVHSVQRVQDAAEGQSGDRRDDHRAGDSRHAQADGHRRSEAVESVHDHPYRGSEARRGTRRQRREIHRRTSQPVARRSAQLDRPCDLLHRDLGLFLPPDERRRGRGDVIRPQPGEGLRGRRSEGPVCRRRRRRRG